MASVKRWHGTRRQDRGSSLELLWPGRGQFSEVCPQSLAARQRLCYTLLTGVSVAPFEMLARASLPNLKCVESHPKEELWTWD